jgi:hypothetical protein
MYRVNQSRAKARVAQEKNTVGEIHSAKILCE